MVEEEKPGYGSAGPPSSIGLIELFLLFSQLGLTSFGGGVSAWVHRAFVEQRRLIGESPNYRPKRFLWLELITGG